MKPAQFIYFRSAADFRAWLEAHYVGAAELWVGFYKKASGRGGITYDEAVEEALCFGWIDGVKKRVDDFSYCHRFTPRRPRSIWSRINIARVARLKRAGRMMPAGLKAFAARKTNRSGIYIFENPSRALLPDEQRSFEANAAAWEFFQRQPPGYRRLVIGWIAIAKRLETRERRLRALIADSGAGRRLDFMASKGKSNTAK